MEFNRSTVSHALPPHNIFAHLREKVAGKKMAGAEIWDGKKGAPAGGLIIFRG
jgi:hypothetical protein